MGSALGCRKRVAVLAAGTCNARKAVHPPTMALATYGHVIEEPERAGRRPAEEVIRKARVVAPGASDRQQVSVGGDFDRRGFDAGQVGDDGVLGGVFADVD